MFPLYITSEISYLHISDQWKQVHVVEVILYILSVTEVTRCTSV